MSNIDDAFDTLEDLKNLLRQTEEHKIARAISTYEAAKSLIDAQQISDAISVLLEGIQPIDPRDQYNWGVVYYNGLGVTQNYDSAYYWFKKAGGNGYAEAKEAVEIMLSNGEVSASKDGDSPDLRPHQV